MFAYGIQWFYWKVIGEIHLSNWVWALGFGSDQPWSYQSQNQHTHIFSRLISWWGLFLDGGVILRVMALREWRSARDSVPIRGCEEFQGLHQAAMHSPCRSRLTHQWCSWQQLHWQVQGLGPGLKSLWFLFSGCTRDKWGLSRDKWASSGLPLCQSTEQSFT